MRGPFFASISLLLFCAISYSDEAEQILAVDFEAATASIAPRSSDGPIQLPGLTFEVRAQPRCPAPEIPVSFSVSIADSQITVTPADNSAVEDEIHVSAKQLGPVVANDFCLDGNADSTQQLELKGALSAQLSLRCKGENSESISYVTAPLNVMLLCEAPEPDIEL